MKQIKYLRNKWIGATVALFAVMFVFVYRESSRVRSYSINSWSEDPKADCAIVLTGGGGRIQEGFDLLSHKSIQKLIISGVYSKSELREIFPQWPFYSELNKDDIILEKKSGTTYGNAQQSLPLVEALNCRNIILITSNLHMYRSMKIFKKAFPKNLPIYSRAVVSHRAVPGSWETFVEVFKSLFYSIWAY